MPIYKTFLLVFLLGVTMIHSITTPRGSNVSDTCYPAEHSAEYIAYLDSVYQENYPNAILIASASNAYNCHAYAWHMSEGGGTIWIGCATSTAEDIFWTDGSYDEVASSVCTKIRYSGNHSAIKSTGGYYISKWGPLPRMKHYPNDCPGIYGSPYKYYRRSVDVPTDISSIASAMASAASGQTSVVSTSQTISSNVIIGSGVTLSINSGVTVNIIPYYYLKCSGSGVIVNKQWNSQPE